MKSFVILQRAFVSLLCDSPRVLQSSRWSRSDTHRLTLLHTHTKTLTGRFTHFPFNGWHRSTCLVTYTEMIMSFLAICLSLPFLFVGNVAVKAAWHLNGSWHVYKQSKWKCFTTLFSHIVSRSVTHLQIFPPKNLWTPRRTDACALSYLAITLIQGVMPKKQKHNVKVFIHEMKHIMAPLVH